MVRRDVKRRRTMDEEVRSQFTIAEALGASEAPDSPPMALHAASPIATPAVIVVTPHAAPLPASLLPLMHRRVTRRCVLKWLRAFSET
ncbi:Uncharacterized protein TCM_017748 [Theobroma cacao]|uniref:Uncharacterized protein n=1 Tax=Theobroma cacao TaxID=3641 RepID=A0A061EE40_THECC|nr:Uncharacterized protein TCM_017748 [Theobroma cacao]